MFGADEDRYRVGSHYLCPRIALRSDAILCVCRGGECHWGLCWILDCIWLDTSCCAYRTRSFLGDEHGNRLDMDESVRVADRFLSLLGGRVRLWCSDEDRHWIRGQHLYVNRSHSWNRVLCIRGGGRLRRNVGRIWCGHGHDIRGRCGHA